LFNKQNFHTRIGACFSANVGVNVNGVDGRYVDYLRKNLPLYHLAIMTLYRALLILIVW